MSFGGTAAQNTEDVTTDTDGNVYIVGEFQGLVDFDPGVGTENLLSSLGWDLFVLKLDSLGNFVWVKSIGGDGNETADGIGVDSQGNIFVSGSFEDSVDFDPNSGIFNLYSNGDQDAYIFSLNSSGELQWAKGIGGIQSDVPFDLCVDNNGDLYTTGRFRDTVDFDPGIGQNITVSEGSWDVFTVKLSNSGNYLWHYTMGGTGTDIGISTDTDSLNQLYATGYVSGSLTPFVLHTNTGQWTLPPFLGETFILKFTAGGDLIWNKQISGSGVKPYSIHIDKDSNIYIVGEHDLYVDLDLGPNSDLQFADDIGAGYYIKFDSLGNTLHGGTVNGQGDQMIRSVATDHYGNAYFVGAFMHDVDFDPGLGIFELSSVSYYDYFMMMLTKDGDFIYAGSAGSGGYDIGYSVAVCPTGRLYAVGNFYVSVDFDFDPLFSEVHTSQGNGDGFIQRFAPCTNSSLIPENSLLPDIIQYCQIDSLTPPEATNSCGYTYKGIPNISFPIDTLGTSTVTWTYIDNYSDTLTQLQNITLASLASDISVDTTQGVISFEVNGGGNSFSWYSDCTGGFVPISQANSNTYTPTSNGSYAVLVSNGICTDTSDCIIIGDLSTQHYDKNTIQVYPNPNNGTFTISLDNASNTTYEVTLTDLAGRVVYKSNLSGGLHTVNSNNLADGSYLLNLNGNSISVSKKVIIRH